MRGRLCCGKHLCIRYGAVDTPHTHTHTPSGLAFVCMTRQDGANECTVAIPLVRGLLRKELHVRGMNGSIAVLLYFWYFVVEIDGERKGRGILNRLRALWIFGSLDLWSEWVGGPKKPEGTLEEVYL
jgi:hypothetical protein